MSEAAAAVEERRRALGLKIREARKAKRWKQKQLAAAVNVEPMTVSRWERGQHAPDLDMLDLVAAALERPISFFVDENAVSGAGAVDLALVLARIDGVQASVDELRSYVHDRLGDRPTPRAAAAGPH